MQEEGHNLSQGHSEARSSRRPDAPGRGASGDAAVTKHFPCQEKAFGHDPGALRAGTGTAPS